VALLATIIFKIEQLHAILAGKQFHRLWRSQLCWMAIPGNATATGLFPVDQGRNPHCWDAGNRRADRSAGPL